MRQVVRDNFFDFTAKREGFTPFMYCDTLNLVTTGVGNLIDNGPRNAFDISPSAMAPAMNLPWRFKAVGWTTKNPVAEGTASQDDIREAWIRTKLRQQNDEAFIAAGGIKQGGFKYANFTPLTLDMDGLKTLFNKTLNSFDATLRSRYPGYENWPADAQMALLSMSWAMGPAFNFPSFKAACDRLDFRQAGELSFFKGGGGTLENRSGRNAENVIMFNNAADVLKGGIDLDRLFFPGTPATSSGATAGGGGATPVPGDGLAIGPISTRIVKRMAQGAAPVAVVGLLGISGYGLYAYGTEKGWYKGLGQKIRGSFEGVIQFGKGLVK